MSIPDIGANEPASHAEAIGVFKEIVEHRGVDDIKAVLAADEISRLDGFRGSIVEDDDQGITLNVDDEGVSFVYRGWGPYTLSSVEVEFVLQEYTE